MATDNQQVHDFQYEAACGEGLESMAGQRHQGPLLSLARRIWPRALIRRFLSGLGRFMLIESRK
jgi:hypothetical protein